MEKSLRNLYGTFFIRLLNEISFAIVIERGAMQFQTQSGAPGKEIHGRQIDGEYSPFS